MGTRQHMGPDHVRRPGGWATNGVLCRPSRSTVGRQFGRLAFIGCYAATNSALVRTRSRPAEGCGWANRIRTPHPALPRKRGRERRTLPREGEGLWTRFRGGMTVTAVGGLVAFRLGLAVSVTVKVWLVSGVVTVTRVMENVWRPASPAVNL